MPRQARPRPRGPVRSWRQRIFTGSPARIDAIASSPGNVLASLAVDPAHDGLQALVGRRVSSGFRRAVDELLPGEADLGTVRYQLLDDMPTALLVSGYAVLAGWHAAGGGLAGSGLQPPRRRGGASSSRLTCAPAGSAAASWSPAWRERHPAVLRGPRRGRTSLAPTPAIATAIGWHPYDPLPPGGMRRRRRIDVWLDVDQHGTRLVQVDSFFRDSYCPVG